MVSKEHPHYLWIGAFGAVALALGGLAWWLWAGPEEPTPAGPGIPHGGGGQGTGSPHTTAAERAKEREDARYSLAVDHVLEAAGAALADGDFGAARSALSAVPAGPPWPNSLKDLLSRIEAREAAFRSALRPIEFRIETLDSVDPSESYFARFCVEETEVFATPELAPSLAATEEDRQANIATLRTSFHLGATVEILSVSGMFGGPELVLGPLPLSPLPELGGGKLTFEDPDGHATRLVVGYRMSPYDPGLVIDHPIPDPPKGATAAGLLDALGAALAKDQTAAATRMLDRLSVEHPGHPDLAFNEERIDSRIESLARNRTRVRFVVMEVACDPRTGGQLWATNGDHAPLRCAIQSGKDTLAKTPGPRCAPYLIPGEAIDPPEGNVLEVRARGDRPLRFTVTDTSPTFGSRDVGTVDLGLTLADLPKGSGTLTLEREPMVLVLPENETNRLRRVVLRWTVTR